MLLVSQIFALMLVFLPVVLWGYIFSSIETEMRSIRRFLIGILTGAILMLPIVYSKDIYSQLWLSGIFTLVSSEQSGFPLFQEYLMVSLLASGIMGVLLFILAIRSVISLRLWVYRSIIGIGVIALLGALFASLFPSFGTGELSLLGAELRTLSAIIVAYVFIASIEESSKHLSLYASLRPHHLSSSNLLVASVFGALGFVFLENCFYTLSYVSSVWLFSSEFLGTLTSRSIVSLLLHVFATILLTLWFIKFLDRSPSKAWPSYIGYFILAVGVHALFNVSLTYGKTGIIFLYAVIGYFVFTGIFFRPSSTEGEPVTG